MAKREDSAPSCRLSEESRLAEQEINRTRAALLSVVLATDPQFELLSRLHLLEPPLLVEDAVQILTSKLPTGVLEEPLRRACLFREKVRAQAATILANAALLGGQKKKLGLLAALLGGTKSVDKLQKLAGKVDPKSPQAPDNLQRLLYGLPPLKWAKPFPLAALGGSAPAPQIDLTTSFDTETLVTTVRTTSTSSRLGAQELKDVMDPQNWTRSPFWKECYAARAGSTGFVQEPRIDGFWKGFCFEHVEWNWDELSVASFQNYLNVDFFGEGAGEAQYETEEQETITLRFSLHLCQGSSLYASEAPNGVDVDHGYLKATPVKVIEDGLEVDGYMLETEKNIRFADPATEPAPLQGFPGTGTLLSYLAPLVVSLWIRDLIAGIYLQEGQQMSNSPEPIFLPSP